MAVTGRGAFPLRSSLGGFTGASAFYLPHTARKATYNDFFFAAGGVGPVAYTASVAETVTLAEALAAFMATTGAASETVTLSEALGALLTATVAPSEAVALAESIAAVLAADVSPSEAVALAEALGALLAAEVSPAEALSLVEVVNGIVPVWNPGRRYLLRRIKRRFF